MDNKTDKSFSNNPESENNNDLGMENQDQGIPRPETDSQVLDEMRSESDVQEPRVTGAPPPPHAFDTTPPPPPTSGENTPQSEPARPADDGGKKNLGIMIVALVVLMVIFLGLIFYFVMGQPQEPEQPVEQMPIENTLPSPTEVPVSPTPELTEEAVEEIEIGSPEAELSPIESDLEQL